MNQGLKAVDLTSLRNARDLSRQCWKCSRSLIKAFILFYCNTNVLNEYFSLVIYKGLLLNFQKQLLKLSKLLSCLFRVISDMIVTVSKTKLVSIEHRWDVSLPVYNIKGKIFFIFSQGLHTNEDGKSWSSKWIRNLARSMLI